MCLQETKKQVGEIKRTFEQEMDRVSQVYVSVHSQSNMPMFCPKKLISQPRVVEKSPFLAWRTLTHYILMSVIFRPHLTPPICLKMTKCAIFSTFRESHFEHTPKVGVRREKFNIGNVAQFFFGGFYICWD